MWHIASAFRSSCVRCGCYRTPPTPACALSAQPDTTTPRAPLRDRLAASWRPMGGTRNPTQ
eukprot:2207089-Pleurochrysis_carterae.AAC.1